jgi:hypothetical protein
MGNAPQSVGKLAQSNLSDSRSHEQQHHHNDGVQRHNASITLDDYRMCRVVTESIVTSGKKKAKVHSSYIEIYHVSSLPDMRDSHRNVHGIDVPIGIIRPTSYQRLDGKSKGKSVGKGESHGSGIEGIARVILYDDWIVYRYDGWICEIWYIGDDTVVSPASSPMIQPRLVYRWYLNESSCMSQPQSSLASAGPVAPTTNFGAPDIHFQIVPFQPLNHRHDNASNGSDDTPSSSTTGMTSSLSSVCMLIINTMEGFPFPNLQSTLSFFLLDPSPKPPIAASLSATTASGSGEGGSDNEYVRVPTCLYRYQTEGHFTRPVFRSPHHIHATFNSSSSPAISSDGKLSGESKRSDNMMESTRASPSPPPLSSSPTPPSTLTPLQPSVLRPNCTPVLLMILPYQSGDRLHIYIAQLECVHSLVNDLIRSINMSTATPTGDVQSLSSSLSMNNNDNPNVEQLFQIRVLHQTTDLYDTCSRLSRSLHERKDATTTTTTSMGEDKIGIPMEVYPYYIGSRWLLLSVRYRDRPVDMPFSQWSRTRLHQPLLYDITNGRVMYQLPAQILNRMSWTLIGNGNTIIDDHMFGKSASGDAIHRDGYDMKKLRNVKERRWLWIRRDSSMPDVGYLYDLHTPIDSSLSPLGVTIPQRYHIRLPTSIVAPYLSELNGSATVECYRRDDTRDYEDDYQFKLYVHPSGATVSRPFVDNNINCINFRLSAVPSSHHPAAISSSSSLSTSSKQLFATTTSHLSSGRSSRDDIDDPSLSHRVSDINVILSYRWSMPEKHYVPRGFAHRWVTHEAQHYRYYDNYGEDMLQWSSQPSTFITSPVLLYQPIEALPSVKEAFIIMEKKGTKMGKNQSMMSNNDVNQIATATVQVGGRAWPLRKSKNVLLGQYTLDISSLLIISHFSWVWYIYDMIIGMFEFLSLDHPHLRMASSSSSPSLSSSSYECMLRLQCKSDAYDDTLPESQFFSLCISRAMLRRWYSSLMSIISSLSSTESRHSRLPLELIDIIWAYLLPINPSW